MILVGSIMCCYFIFKQKISSLQVVLKEELHTDTLPGQAESPFVEQEAHPAENSLCLCACRRHTEELPGQSDKVRILLPSAPPPTKRIKVSSQSRLVSVPKYDLSTNILAAD